MSNLKNSINNIYKGSMVTFVKYNLKVVFGNKFIYFLGASLIFYFLVTLINLFASDTVSVQGVYYQLMFPAFLLIFFPTAYGIQNDEDARILEILFGIPNYRYKVWLLRLAIALFIVFWLVFVMANMSSMILIKIPVWEMTLRLMVPVCLIGMLGFFFSTVVKNGNGTAVIVVVIGLIAWFLMEFIGDSSWNIFLNPFDLPSDMSESVWASIVNKHVRTWLVVALVAGLWGMLILQQREQFIK